MYLLDDDGMDWTLWVVVDCLDDLTFSEILFCCSFSNTGLGFICSCVLSFETCCEFLRGFLSTKPVKYHWL